MTKRKLVFLDLEGTVISMIDDPVLMNMSKVGHWLKNEKVDNFGIFSFAIDNKEERDEFTRGWVYKTLEQRFDRPIGRIVTTEEAMKGACGINRVSFEGLWEFKQLWGKERGFIDFGRQMFNNFEVPIELVLLDDMVPNMIVELPDINLTIRLVNVDSLV